MGGVSKKVFTLVKKFGSQILFLLFVLELLITTIIWITEKITIELGFGNIFLLNTYALLPYIINFSAEWKKPSKHEHVIIIDFYSSVVFWGISLMMDFSEFNVLLFYHVLVYLGFFISIIFLLLNPKPKRDSFTSIIQFVLSIIIILMTIVILILVLIAPPTLLPLQSAEIQWYSFIVYLVLFGVLLILKFKPETKKESP